MFSFPLLLPNSVAQLANYESVSRAGVRILLRLSYYVYHTKNSKNVF